MMQALDHWRGDARHLRARAPSASRKASGATGVDYWFVFDERLADRLAAGLEPELARLEAFDAAFNE